MEGESQARMARNACGQDGAGGGRRMVGLGQVGIVLSLECSRLARNNTDW
jgi:hypothetical protein